MRNITTTLYCSHNPPQNKLYLPQNPIKKQFCTDGVQGRLSPNVPLWHVGDFKLKTVKAQQTEEQLFNLPLNCLKEFI